MPMTWRKALFIMLLAVVTIAAFANAAQSGGTSKVRNKLTLIAPAAPGGGWDGFAREAQTTMRAEGVVNNVQVVNVPGAGGTIGLAQFAQMRGRSDIMMVTGGVMIGAIALSDPSKNLSQVTPIARMADDYAALVVPADSKITDVKGFVEAWKKNPTGTSFAGGSLGSIDHLATGMLAKAAGINPKDANYIAYSGGGEALAAMLSHTTTAGMSGYNEVAGQIEAGQLRLLAVSSSERLPGVDAPTFKEAGLDVELSNWRGFVAPAGLGDEEVTELKAIVDEMHQTEAWGQVLTKNSWTDSYLVGDEFKAYIDEQQTITNKLVKELGL